MPSRFPCALSAKRFRKKRGEGGAALRTPGAYGAVVWWTRWWLCGRGGEGVAVVHAARRVSVGVAAFVCALLSLDSSVRSLLMYSRSSMAK